MFTEQVPQLISQLVSSGMPTQQAQAIGDAFGNCIQKLSHRGPIDLDYRWPDGATDDHALLDLNTDDDGVALRVRGGKAIFSGDVQIDGDLTIGGETGSLGVQKYRFRNDSGFEVPAWGVMRITGNIGSTGTPVFTTARPDSTFRRNYVVNHSASAVPDGSYGTCRFLGPGPVARDGTEATPVVGETWGVKSGQFTLVENRPGFEILGVYGTNIVFADHVPPSKIKGKLDGTLSQGGSQTVSVWARNGSGTEVDTGQDVTGYDWLMKSGAANIASGKKASLFYESGRWIFDQVECA